MQTTRLYNNDPREWPRLLVGADIECRKRSPITLAIEATRADDKHTTLYAYWTGTTDVTVTSRYEHTIKIPTLCSVPVYYFGILYQNNFNSHRRINHSALQFILLLYLPCPRIIFTLNCKMFSLNNTFLLRLVCTNSCRFSGPLI